MTENPSFSISFELVQWTAQLDEWGSNKKGWERLGIQAIARVANLASLLTAPADTIGHFSFGVFKLLGTSLKAAGNLFITKPLLNKEWQSSYFSMSEVKRHTTQVINQIALLIFGPLYVNLFDGPQTMLTKFFEKEAAAAAKVREETKASEEAKAKAEAEAVDKAKQEALEVEADTNLLFQALEEAEAEAIAKNTRTSEEEILDVEAADGLARAEADAKIKAEVEAEEKARVVAEKKRAVEEAKEKEQEAKKAVKKAVGEVNEFAKEAKVAKEKEVEARKAVDELRKKETEAGKLHKTTKEQEAKIKAKEAEIKKKFGLKTSQLEKAKSEQEALNSLIKKLENGGRYTAADLAKLHPSARKILVSR